MAYAVKEIYYTLQGEGINAGRPAVFLRFAGCNLWSGREVDRGAAVCRFCDTDFVGIDGPGGGSFVTAERLAAAVSAAWPPNGSRPGRRLVVCTGGEPLPQLDEAAIDALHGHGFDVAVETNGTLSLPAGLDWICVSPKSGTTLAVTAGHELKLVVPQASVEPGQFEHLAFDHFLLQPMAGEHTARNTQWALDYCLAHPQWRLSLQTHKILRIP